MRVLNSIIKDLPEISGIDSQLIDLNIPFMEICLRFADLHGTVALVSGGNLEASRFHILGVMPLFTIKTKGDRIELEGETGIEALKTDPFEFLKLLLTEFDLSGLNNSQNLPLLSGLMGYFSYDLKDHIEKLPRTSIDDLHLPDLYFVMPKVIFVHAIREDKTYMQIIKLKGQSEQELNELKQEIITRIESSAGISGNSFSLSRIRVNFSKSEYIKSVNKIRDFIKAGDVYQVNLSQRFIADFSGHPFSLFTYLLEKNPASFFAFINAGDHQVVSTSPERFLKIDGFDVVTRPIKGTRPRGKTKIEDERLKNELAESSKDDAELSMIVDLMRNDLGKVCQAGSVKVRHHKEMEAYENVFHLVSAVAGKLDRDKNGIDLIKAAFPGGSITGCPKIRALEIIDELEPHRRHVYTGSIGYISFHNTMDLNIAIRTATIVNGKIVFSVGGGIVYDSDPEDEYNETLAKGKTIMSALSDRQSVSGKQEAFFMNTDSNADNYIAWHNGTIKPIEEIQIPFNDLGFQYGHGLFETIRLDKGKPLFLAEHLKRMGGSWKSIFMLPFPDLSWPDIIAELVKVNDLENSVAVMKIIITAGSRSTAPYDHSIIVTVNDYQHRLKKSGRNGFNLVTYPEPRQTPLANHKTMNYMYLHLAGKWASEQGADEAIITNPDVSISETNTGNLIFIKGKTAIIPKSPFYLRGIMQNAVIEFLNGSNYSIKEQKIEVTGLFSYNEILVTNSLLGAVPVLSIDGKKINTSPKLYEIINNEFRIRWDE